MLTELLKGWTPFESEGSFNHSYRKCTKDGVLLVLVLSLSTPGDWYVEMTNGRTEETVKTSCDKDECLTLADALQYGNRFIDDYKQV